MYRRDGQLLPSEPGGAGVYDSSLGREYGVNAHLLTEGFVPRAPGAPHRLGLNPKLLTDGFVPGPAQAPHLLGLNPHLLTAGFAGETDDADDDFVPPPDKPEYAPWPTGGVDFYRSDWWRLASLAGTVVGAYHGYKRNNSVGWAVGWGALGALFPIFVIPIAVAQGIGKPKR